MYLINIKVEICELQSEHITCVPMSKEAKYINSNVIVTTILKIVIYVEN